MGSVVASRVCCSMAHGIFPDQGSNLCALHWQLDSYPLLHWGSSHTLLLAICNIIPKTETVAKIMILCKMIWTSVLQLETLTSENPNYFFIFYQKHISSLLVYNLKTYILRLTAANISPSFF